MSEWHNLAEYPQIRAWQSDRSHIVNTNGVADVITLHLQDARDGEIITVVLPPDIAMALGWDLMGEAGNFFAARPDPVDADETFG
jgi:hypothetical protein